MRATLSLSVIVFSLGSFALNPKTGTVYVREKLPKEKTMTDKESVARNSF